MAGGLNKVMIVGNLGRDPERGAARIRVKVGHSSLSPPAMGVIVHDSRRQGAGSAHGWGAT